MKLIVNDECKMDGDMSMGGDRTRRGGHCAPMLAVAKMLQCEMPHPENISIVMIWVKLIIRHRSKPIDEAIIIAGFAD